MEKKEALKLAIENHHLNTMILSTLKKMDALTNGLKSEIKNLDCHILPEFNFREVASDLHNQYEKSKGLKRVVDNYLTLNYKRSETFKFWDLVGEAVCPLIN